MTPRDLRNIHTTRNGWRDAIPCANMTLKLPWYFYQLMEKPLGCYFQVRSPYYQVTQWIQKTPISISSRWQIRSVKAKKGYASTLIRTTTSVHLLKPISTDLTIKPDSVLTNSILKIETKEFSQVLDDLHLLLLAKQFPKGVHQTIKGTLMQIWKFHYMFWCI